MFAMVGAGALMTTGIDEATARVIELSGSPFSSFRQSPL